MYNENFIVSRNGQIAVVFNACSKNRLLASNYGVESVDTRYTFITSIKSLGAIYFIVNHAVLAQQELGKGIKQGMRGSVVCFLERVQETFSQAYGPVLEWSSHSRTNLIESVVKGMYNRRLVDLIATCQIPIPFSFIHF